MATSQTQEGFLHTIAAEQLFARAFLHDSPGLQDIAAIADFQGFADVLFDQQDGGPLVVELADDFHDGLDQEGRQPHGRLVQHQQAGAGHECPADGQDLLLAAGKGARGLVGPLLEDGEALADVLQVPAHRPLVPAMEGPQFQVGSDAQGAEDPAAFRHQGQAQGNDALRRLPGEILAIGRALMARPRLLMLDEPSMGLAPRMVTQVYAILAELKAAGTTILLVEQNARAALKVADRGYVLETGRIILDGSAADLRDDPEVQRAYLGKGYQEVWE